MTETIQGHCDARWGGHADAARTRPWTSDTIVNVWSSTKTVTSLAALMLIDRGLLDPSAKVTTYWPEFGANGKQDIEVRHILAHTSGLSGWDQPVVVEDVYDWDKSTAALAAQAPWWEPGTASGYHAADMGAVNGHTNARALTRILSSISLGGAVDGVRLLRPETIEKIFEVQCDGPDLVLAGHRIRWGLGFGLPAPESIPFVPDEKICFWGGWGGSWETMNPDRRT
ncbi:MAG: EstA family serine hydrolase, partial [Mycobacterium sp.]|nr:EstA family serine hydrolase [Mycobacterium sp.]